MNPGLTPRRFPWDRHLVPGASSILRTTVARMKVNRVNMAAGAFAYRWFLSFFPLIIALLGVATLVTFPRHVLVNLLHGLTSALPAGAAQVFTSALTHASERTGSDLPATVVASAVALWSATSGMVVIEEGLDMAYGIASDRSFLAKRLVALPLLLGVTLLGGAASTLIIFGPQLGHLVRVASPVGSAFFALTWTAVRWIVALALMNFLFCLLYYLGPNRPRGRWRWTSAGALVATAAWSIFSVGFSFYTSHFGSYGSTYGAFAGVAILIFWLYLTGMAILVGGEVNAAREARGQR